MHDDQAALLAAAVTAGPGAAPADVIRQAGAYLAWFAAPLHDAALRTSRDTYRQASAGPARITTYTPGGAVQLHDDEQVLITLVPRDAKGYTVTDDQVTYTPADPAVISCRPDGLSCLMVAGQPGSTTVAITDGTITYTWAADVVPGTAATFQVTEGTPEKQPAPAPSPAVPASTTPAAAQPGPAAAVSSTAAEGQPGQSPGRAAAGQAQAQDGQPAEQPQTVAEGAGMTLSDPEPQQ